LSKSRPMDHLPSVSGSLLSHANDSVNSPGKLLKQRSMVNEDTGRDSFMSDMKPPMSRHGSVQKSVVPLPIQKPSATPRELTPRITDGWLSGRIEEPVANTGFSSPLFSFDQKFSEQLNYQFFDSTDVNSDRGSSLEDWDLDNHGNIGPITSSFIRESAVNAKGVNLPFKYESDFYQ